MAIRRTVPLDEVRLVSGQLEVSGRQLELMELGDPFVARSAYRPFVRRCLAVMCVAVVAGGAIVVFDHAVLIRIVTVALLVVALAVTAVVVTASPTRYVLYAPYRGRAEALFESRDVVKFNQVCRAVGRARAVHAAEWGLTRPAVLPSPAVGRLDRPRRVLLAASGVVLLLSLFALVDGEDEIRARPVAGSRSPQATRMGAQPSRPSPGPVGPHPHPLLVPAVAGVGLADAHATLTDAGLRSRDVDGTGQGRIVIAPNNWVVIAQEPRAGSAVPTGSLITLTVRKWSDQTEPPARASATGGGTIPDVVCQSLPDARDTLHAQGFPNVRSVDALGQRHQIVDSNWLVVKQSAPPGSHPAFDTVVVLSVVKHGENTGNAAC